MNTQIRDAIPADLDVLMEISRRTIRAGYGSFLGERAADAFVGSGACDRYVQTTLPFARVLLVDRHLAGYAVCRGDLLDMIVVDLPRQRRGFGALLLRDGEDRILDRHKVARAESFEKNSGANRFLLAHGWTEAARFHEQETGLRKILFRKYSIASPPLPIR